MQRPTRSITGRRARACAMPPNAGRRARACAMPPNAGNIGPDPYAARRKRRPYVSFRASIKIAPALLLQWTGDSLKTGHRTGGSGLRSQHSPEKSPSPQLDRRHRRKLRVCPITHLSLCRRQPLAIARAVVGMTKSNIQSFAFKSGRVALAPDPLRPIRGRKRSDGKPWHLYTSLSNSIQRERATCFLLPPGAARAPFDKLMIHDKHAALRKDESG